MPIDPVVVLAEELRATEYCLRAATDKQLGGTVPNLVQKIRGICRELAETIPTSALGASELVRLAAQHLPITEGRYARHMVEIADRLGAGERIHTDLVWLRAVAAAFDGGLCGEDGAKAVVLIRLAIAGAARPIVVYRAVIHPE